MTSHLDSHKALKPLQLGPADDVRTAVVAKYLDLALDTLGSVLDDVFLERASSLARWEALYSLDGAGSEEDRRHLLLAARAHVGGLSLPFFTQLADSLGYEVTFHRGVELFRIGISLLGIDPLYSVNIDNHPLPEGWDSSEMGEYCPDLWTCTVTVTSLGSNSSATRLKSEFETRKPPFCFFKWEGLS